MDEYLERSGMDLGPSTQGRQSGNGDVANRIDQKRCALARPCEKLPAVVRDQPSPQGRAANNRPRRRLQQDQHLAILGLFLSRVDQLKKWALQTH
jgi:hypothetical protein